MTGRSRDFDALSEAQIAAGLISSAKRIDPSALVAKDIGGLLNTIDVVAEAATGERSFLHLRPRQPRPAERKR